MSELRPNHRNDSLMIYTASGFRTDIETLFSKFDETKGLQFTAFGKCFKDMKFSLIFRGRHNDNEMHEFIDECYLEVLSQLVNEDKVVSHRICSLYLLYALYVKQPLDQSTKTRFDVKIRITLDQLKIIRHFIDYCHRNRYLDVCYVWCKLVAIGIDFVYYRYSSLGPSNTRSVNYFMFQNSNSSTDKLIIDLKKSIEPRLKSLETNHEIYNEFKDRVFDGDQNAAAKKPNVISTELHKDSMYSLNKLINDFKYLNRKFKGRGRPSVWTPYTSQEESGVIEDTNRMKIQVHKRAIKSKVKTENDTINSILWNEDIINNLKRAKRKQQLKKNVKIEPKIEIEDLIESPPKVKRKYKRKTKETKEFTKIKLKIKVKKEPKESKTSKIQKTPKKTLKKKSRAKKRKTR